MPCQSGAIIACDEAACLSVFMSDPARHIHKTAGVVAPSLDECRKSYKHINFQQFMSTWVSVTAKGIEWVPNQGSGQYNISIISSTV